MNAMLDEARHTVGSAARRGIRAARRARRRVERRLQQRTAPPQSAAAPTRPAATTPARAPDPTPPSRFALLTAPLDLSGVGLEIGPSHRPLLPKRDGYRVMVADHLDQAGLVAKYDGVRATAGIEAVDFVLTGNRLVPPIDVTFDYIVASHVLEHTVCLVSFLQDCESLLRAGGVLSLALPDRRFCFDRFRERSSLATVIDTYDAQPQVHSRGAVLEYYLDVVAKGTSISWYRGAPGDFRRVHGRAQADAFAAAARSGDYVDVHRWVFTPNHLRLLLADLADLGLIGLRETAFHPTVGSEFFLALSPDGEGSGLTRDQLTVLASRESREADRDAFV